ncbi:hypothetical protein OPV22_016538 [Ensete ventricosum]|uniref:Secreted protein n=1 Tax=Ensete ventricosum TaxID=4639 RepID=A0AAV8R060_ENSVE|nr:hypothetical protein OPV22_016538 [Ensete ventricosum]
MSSAYCFLCDLIMEVMRSAVFVMSLVSSCIRLKTCCLTGFSHFFELAFLLGREVAKLHTSNVHSKEKNSVDFQAGHPSSEKVVWLMSLLA